MIVRTVKGDIDLKLNPLTIDDYENIKIEYNKEGKPEYYIILDDLDEFGIDDPTGEKTQSNVEEGLRYETYRKSIYINNKLAGICHLDDISENIEEREFLAGVYLFRKFRGNKLNSIILDMLALISNANKLYLMIDNKNIASIRASKGFTITSYDKLEYDERFQDSIDDGKSGKDYIILVKNYR